MSVEAISWALNLAPVPVDTTGKPNSACAFVLVGLANHADPDGTVTYPSVDTLVRYTRLSERTVRTALDRLETARLITPCPPEVIAARIPRADRRPQGWDLDLTQVRTDLDDDAITRLERQYPGLRARILAARAAVEPGQPETRPAQNDTPEPVDNPRNGVQPLHPEAVAPVDNGSGGVQRLHPVRGTGCNQRGSGVQRTQERGAAVAPEPSIEPSREPSAAAPARARGTGPPAGTPAGGGAAGEFFDALGPGWLLTAGQRSKLASAVREAVAAGWEPEELAAFVGANSAGVRSPFAVLSARLSPAELPVPRPPASPRRRPWCGHCDPDTRFLLDEHGYPGDSPRRCPQCGPAPAKKDPA